MVGYKDGGMRQNLKKNEADIQVMKNKWFIDDKRIEIYVAAKATPAPLTCYEYKTTTTQYTQLPDTVSSQIINTSRCCLKWYRQPPAARLNSDNQQLMMIIIIIIIMYHFIIYLVILLLHYYYFYY